MTSLVFAYGTSDIKSLKPLVVAEKCLGQSQLTNYFLIEKFKVFNPHSKLITIQQKHQPAFSPCAIRYVITSVHTSVESRSSVEGSRNAARHVYDPSSTGYAQSKSVRRRQRACSDLANPVNLAEPSFLSKDPSSKFPLISHGRFRRPL
jgi:hypothetical protein